MRAIFWDRGVGGASFARELQKCSLYLFLRFSFLWFTLRKCTEICQIATMRVYSREWLRRKQKTKLQASTHSGFSFLPKMEIYWITSYLTTAETNIRVSALRLSVEGCLRRPSCLATGGWACSEFIGSWDWNECCWKLFVSFCHVEIVQLVSLEKEKAFRGFLVSAYSKTAHGHRSVGTFSRPVSTVDWKATACYNANVSGEV